MNDRKSFAGLIAAAGLALTVLIGPALSGQHEPPRPSMREMAAMPSMQQLERTSGRAFEVAFLSEMIEHHAGGVEVSTMTADAARRSEVKRAAQKVASTQKKEMAQMSGWLRDWYQQQPDPELRALVRRDSAPLLTSFKAACAATATRLS